MSELGLEMVKLLGFLDGALQSGNLNEHARKYMDAAQEEHVALEARLEEPAHCNSGHETLPLKLWTCPTCHEEVEAELVHIKRALHEAATGEYEDEGLGYQERVALAVEVLLEGWEPVAGTRKGIVRTNEWSYAIKVGKNRPLYTR